MHEGSGNKREKRNFVLSRGLMLPRDPNSSVPPNFTSYPNDNMFPKRKQEKKCTPPPQGVVVDSQVDKRTRVTDSS